MQRNCFDQQAAAKHNARRQEAPASTANVLSYETPEESVKPEGS